MRSASLTRLSPPQTRQRTQTPREPRDRVSGRLRVGNRLKNVAPSGANSSRRRKPRKPVRSATKSSQAKSGVRSETNNNKRRRRVEQSDRSKHKISGKKSQQRNNGSKLIVTVPSRSRLSSVGPSNRNHSPKTRKEIGPKKPDNSAPRNSGKAKRPDVNSLTQTQPRAEQPQRQRARQAQEQPRERAERQQRAQPQEKRPSEQAGPQRKSGEENKKKKKKPDEEQPNP